MHKNSIYITSEGHGFNKERNKKSLLCLLTNHAIVNQGKLTRMIGSPHVIGSSRSYV